MNKKKLIVSTILLLVMWHVASLILNKNILPSPLKVVPHLLSIFNSKLIIHIFYSFSRIIFGILFGIAIGWPMGIIVGYFKKADDYISPIIYFIYPIPKIALLPIFMLLFGLGEFTKIFIIFLIVLFQIIVNIRDCIKDLDPTLYYPLNALGSKDSQIIQHILIPASLPSLFSSVRISLGTSIAILFFSETFGTTYGLGYFIMDSMLRINYVEMYSGIVVLSLLGLFLFILIDIISNKYLKWQ
ncbi:ABC transporter permease subunit [Alkalibaculum sp. M08DMB]|uniref:ABC transporter permease subunit n=1 Tax=Alkalibaculum sporogenes TaxID=2655001 RepID=A0A6A7KBY5_9FIRM|nr:ABC transporter permease [Alkalibaculum sporogenes]MPW26906.1 ABC transporter permease subunit [Alkalibaculum sporogenes]